MTTSTAAAVRTLLAPVYGPLLGMSVCLGMLSVALPLYLADAGVSYLSLSAVLAAAAIGSAAGGVPTGDAIARFGPRRVRLLGGLAIAAGVVPLAATDDPVALFALQLVVGLGTIALRISGQTWIVRSVQSNVRGRLLSGMGGMRRFGAFVGPFLAGLIIEWRGFGTAFVVAGVLAAIGVVPLLLTERVVAGEPGQRLPLGEVFRRHWRLLLVATAGPILIMAARRGRSVVIPLIGDDLGMSPAAVGLLVSVGTGADLVLFPVAGYLMDTFGRLTAIVPAFCLMGAGLVLLALAESGTMVAMAGAVIGVGNGLSSGTMMTLGTDLAPEDSTSQFLAGFASLQDWGAIIGPLLVGWVAAGVGLSASAAVLAVVILAGVALIVRNIGETAGRSPVGSERPA